ncbi:sulfate ABC transporter substrate-binding protein [Nodularia harveyana UHCC-0300]|uniref:Sulfate ABC transporter substrate-binding protein n=1 Tax=Nodularia harveyana UHCC-0300 TaxID=2974287 RepID=A0ABU5UEA5_9CYAN|nr:sulfate ABC transporter substrate-binding protein [Nodularia harveyana]MEA5581499.1 sulfate ABC transporter substrate-binding protein [Nodularia harveyana UHCC-0300]
MWLNIFHQWKHRSLKSFMALFLVGIGLSSAIAACSPSPGDSGSTAQTKELTLVSYAVTRAAYENIIPLFTKQWQETTGQTVRFDQSYGGSGSQTRAVIDGLEADIVALALSADTLQLQDAGLIQPGWEKKTPNNDGIVHRSVGVIVTREDNPKNIKDWDDLARDDVSVITANPKTSGGARWNYMALWGKVTKTGGTEQQAKDFVTKVYSNVPVLPRDAREATDAFFTQGQGDALINYENEVILAKQQGQELPYIVPEINISIDNPIAVVDKYVDQRGNREVAEAFVQFLFTPAAQREFAKVGFRPVVPEVIAEFADNYPQISNLFTIEDFGGWNQVSPKFFADGAIFDDIQANITRR